MQSKMEKFVGAEEIDMKANAGARGGEIDPEMERRITKKLDHHILPWLFILWLLAFIDRSNIGKLSRAFSLNPDADCE